MAEGGVVILIVIVVEEREGESCRGKYGHAFGVDEISEEDLGDLHWLSILHF